MDLNVVFAFLCLKGNKAINVFAFGFIGSVTAIRGDIAVIVELLKLIKAFVAGDSDVEVYVWGNTNSNAKANMIANMLTYYGLPKETVKLAIRGDYQSKERDYSGRTINPDIGTSLLWQDDPTDTHVYSTPTVHKKEQQPEPTQNDIQEKPQTESQVSKVVESNAVVQFCEKMILKRPHKMMIAFTSSVIGKLFENRKNRALSRFQSPHRLSNGVWVETEGITEQQLRQIEKYCDWKVL